MPTDVRNPVEFVRGEGTRLWDSDGNEYLDFLAGIAVVQIGHSHPHWVEAVSEQVARRGAAARELARGPRAGGEIVVLEGGFRGRTYGALSATPQESKQAPFAP